MNITKVTVRQVRQLKQYEPIDITMEAELSAEDDVDKVIKDLKKRVYFYLYDQNGTGPIPVSPPSVSLETLPKHEQPKNIGKPAANTAKEEEDNF